MLRAFFVLAVLLIAGSARAAEPPKVADLVRQLETGSPGERVIAAERLGDLGPGAAEAIPALARTAQTARRLSDAGAAEERRANGHLYHAAVTALVAVGPKSAPALVELLPGEKDDPYGEVSWHIGSFGRDAVPVVPELAKLLADDNQDFRVRVAGVLEKLGPVAEPAIPALVALFENPKNKDDGRWATGSLPPPPRVAAVRALIRIGPKADAALADKIIPALAEELKTGESGSGGDTAEVLSVLGEKGASLVPAAVAIIRKGESKPFLDQEEIGKTLLGLGTTGRKAFVELLTGADPELREELVTALDHYLWCESFPKYHPFGAPSIDLTGFVPGLVAALKDPKPEQRLAAATVLCNRPDKVPASVRNAVFGLFRDPMVKKLLEANATVFYSPNLGQFGEAGSDALLALLDSDSTAVRKFAVDQFRGPRKWSKAARSKLRKLSDGADARLALDAAYTAAWVSLDPKDAAPLVSRRFLHSADPEIRAEAARRIWWLGPVGAPHLDALVPLLDDKDDEIFQAAAKAIHFNSLTGSLAERALADRNLVQNITGFYPAPQGVPRPERRPPTVAELIETATNVEDLRQAEAALDLGDRGAAAKEAVPALKKLLLDPDPEMRFAAAYALARIGGDTPALRQLLAHELERLAAGHSRAYIAATAFERLPPDFPELIPIVARWLEQRPYDDSLCAGLAKYGPKAKAAVPALRKILRGPEKPVHAYFGSERKPACEALAAIGPGARDALPELRQLLDSGDVAFACAAREAIRKITGER